MLPGGAIPRPVSHGVGMLSACQRDATLKRLDARVLSCTRDGERWAVTLDDTVLYAEGGGQPADRGHIAGVRVLDVQRHDGRIVHFTAAAVPLGPAEVVVDWDRRLDHMQQHTAQHLLSAIADGRFGWPTTAFHLPPLAPQAGDPATLPAIARCDVELDVAEPRSEQLAALEHLANAAIREARPVRTLLVGRDALDGVRTRGVPEGVDEVRLVEIEGIDRNTCGGTHCPSTAWIGAVALLGTERVRGGTRLFFLAGDRLRAHVARERARSEAIGRLLSASPEAVVEQVDRLVVGRKASDRAAKALAAELADALGARLATEADVAALHRLDGDAGFLSAVATAALARNPDLLLVLTSGDREGVFLIAGPPERVEAGRPLALELLEGRGGGRPGRLQGRAARLDRREALAERLRSGALSGGGGPR